MKCSIESIRNIKLSNNRYGSRIECFLGLPEDLFIPDRVVDWIDRYQGVNVCIAVDGLCISSWADTKCSEKDTYNSLTGAHIAESKAKTKIYRFLRNFTEKMANAFALESNYMHDMFLKYDHCLNHEIDHTEYLTND